MYARKQDTPFGLRMPQGMRNRVKTMAADNGRSMNSEIIYHLKKALTEAEGLEDADARA
ncbi:Arc family DNA-binding protein [Paracoccus sp. SM22M-07]|uniref:Arc family DNA-binding protein n=1 Tax=Paracoccus sp. SM22M-07 TaxID=1520813 RepID=UPI0009F86989|nr:Arc family DNA-binding protein [Paracoccus sp. SM22M-07]